MSHFDKQGSPETIKPAVKKSTFGQKKHSSPMESFGNQVVYKAEKNNMFLGGDEVAKAMDTTNMAIEQILGQLNNHGEAVGYEEELEMP
jgi:hypothetical protein